MRPLAIILVTMACVYCAWRVAGNVVTRPDVPAACQLMGGKWDLWSGWTCY